MMTTTETTATYATGVTHEQKFLKELEEAFGNASFNARIYPAANGIEKAQVNTGDDIEGEALEKIIAQAQRWKLDLTIGRSGAGIRILFEKDIKS